MVFKTVLIGAALMNQRHAKVWRDLMRQNLKSHIEFKNGDFKKMYKAHKEQALYSLRLSRESRIYGREQSYSAIYKDSIAAYFTAMK